MDRRRFLLRTSGTVAGGLLLPRVGLGLPAVDELPAGTVASGVLDALPGKRPLIKRSFRPPNYESPRDVYRDAYTPNEEFYVRWHSAVPEVALADAEVKRFVVGGELHRMDEAAGAKDA